MIAFCGCGCGGGSRSSEASISEGVLVPQRATVHALVK